MTTTFDDLSERTPPQSQTSSCEKRRTTLAVRGKTYFLVFVITGFQQYVSELNVQFRRHIEGGGREYRRSRLKETATKRHSSPVEEMTNVFKGVFTVHEMARIASALPKAIQEKRTEEVLALIAKSKNIAVGECSTIIRLKNAALNITAPRYRTKKAQTHCQINRLETSLKTINSKQNYIFEPYKDYHGILSGFTVFIVTRETEKQLARRLAKRSEKEARERKMYETLKEKFEG